MRIFTCGILFAATLFLGTPSQSQSIPNGSNPAPKSVPIDHVIVIYLENRSFDHLYGLFPGAEGLAQASATSIQVDKSGKPYDMFPAFNPPAIDPSKPSLKLPPLPNKPFDLSQFLPLDQPINAPFEKANSFYDGQVAIDGGKMDRYVSISGSPTMGYYDGRALPMWRYAQQYVLADHFFQAAFGGTGMNHFLLFCACVPRWPNAPADVVAQIDSNGAVIRDGNVTPDGYLVNNVRTQELAESVPAQTMPHIGDRLDDAGVSWAWYAAAWDSNAVRRVTRPFLFFADLQIGTPSATKHLKGEQAFLDDLTRGSLPNVAFVKPSADEHPAHKNGLLADDRHTAELVETIQKSPYWASSAIIVTYDEGHSFWDHVPPPKIDRWGPGRRVPAIIISPYAKKGFVDKTVYDTTSILRFIEWRWNLPPLTERDAKANNLLAAFDFSREP